jgi:hypothetical protein
MAAPTDPATARRPLARAAEQLRALRRRNGPRRAGPADQRRPGELADDASSIQSLRRAAARAQRATRSTADARRSGS